MKIQIATWIDEDGDLVHVSAHRTVAGAYARLDQATDDYIKITGVDREQELHALRAWQEVPLPTGRTALAHINFPDEGDKLYIRELELED